MKKSIVWKVVLVLGLSIFPISQLNEVNAAPKDVKYNSCKELNKVYKYGVRTSADIKNAVVSKKDKKTTYKATQAVVNAKLYKLNTHLDNDGDKIACEK